MGKLHFFPEERVHHVWDNSLEPGVEVNPGDSVFFETKDATNDQITPASTADIISTLDWDTFYPLAGPVFVKGAVPGDTLVVEVLDVQHRGWGWTGIFPEFGVLPDVFDKPYLRIWECVDGKYASFDERVKVPVAPFAGTMGVAPADTGQHAPMPPTRFGGNMDTKQLTTGSTLYLPVGVEGALFSIGDGHLAQGDGEVCVSAIEGPLGVVCRFDVIKGQELPYPEFETPDAWIARNPGGSGCLATMGVDSNLKEAARKATKHMVDRLAELYDLAPEDAYVVASVAADLRISEMVDPNWIVSAFIPKGIFTKMPRKLPRLSDR